MAVKFEELLTGNEALDRVQQNVTAAISALQAQQTSAGITQVSKNYTLQSTDRYLLVTANTDIVIALGSPTLPFVSTIVNLGPKNVAVRSGDNKTDLGGVATNTNITVIATGATWKKI